MLYQCIKSFITSSNVHYALNQQISYTYFSLLPYNERLYFSEVLEHDDKVLDNILTSISNDDILGQQKDDTPIFQQNDDGLTDFGGFGDGSGGGGGASGSWDNSNDSTNDDN